MGSKSLLNRRVDDNAILTMVVFSVVALMFMAFRYKNYEPCTSIQIEAKASQYQTGEPIQFNAITKNKGNMDWDFGDNTTDQSKGKTAIHAYDEPGEYTISLVINGRCKEYKTILITRAPKPVNTVILPKFICPQTAEVGELVQFKDTTGSSSQWEWSFGETGHVDASTPVASYTYNTPGYKTISLIINGNNQQMGICHINVSPQKSDKPDKRAKKRSIPRVPVPVKVSPTENPLNGQSENTKPVEDKPQAPQVSGKQFETYLMQVVTGDKTASDFSNFLCGNLNTPVSLNGSETTFNALCKKLAGVKKTKKIKSLKVQLVKNEKTNCIFMININLKQKEGLLEKIF